MNFGEAIEYLKTGNKISRKDWNGKGMYLWLKPETIIKSSWCYDSTLLEAIEKHGFTTCTDDFDVTKENCKAIRALGTICMCGVDSFGEYFILTGWLASQSDILSEDWEIIT